MDRRPPQQYAEDVDMIHYRRKDGQRILIVCPIMWTNKEKLTNILMTYHNRQFIDYVLHLEDYKLIENICRYLGVPTFTGESYSQLVQQGMPTSILVLYTDSEARTRYEHILSAMKVNLPIEYVEQ